MSFVEINQFVTELDATKFKYDDALVVGLPPKTTLAVLKVATPPDEIVSLLVIEPPLTLVQKLISPP